MTVTEQQMRDTYKKAFGQEFDSTERKQLPLPLAIAYRVALQKLRDTKFNPTKQMLAERILFKTDRSMTLQVALKTYGKKSTWLRILRTEKELMRLTKQQLTEAIDKINSEDFKLLDGKKIAVIHNTDKYNQ